MHDKLEMTNSSNQSGFVKEMNIIENILQSHDITSDITRKRNLDNTTVKLDMTNAYDKISSFSFYEHLKENEIIKVLYLKSYNIN